MLDTASVLVPGLIITGIILIVGLVLYFIFRKIIPKFLLLFLIFVILGLIFNFLELITFAYTSYLLSIIFFVFFLVSLFRKKKI
jgi:hypothetical protein